MKYTDQSLFKDLIQVNEVKSFLEKTMPQMLEAPASDYIAAMTAEQVAGILPEEAKPLMKSVVEIANGEKPSFVPEDPHTVPATVSLGRMNADYSIDDVDGPMYMLDHRFSGCILLQFSKPMKKEQNGTVTCAGIPCPYVFTEVSAAGGIQLLGVFVREACTEYGKEYTLRLEGFEDEDGLFIHPSAVTFRTQELRLPDPAYKAHDDLAYRAAAESIVLLKNDNDLLPLIPSDLQVQGAEQFRISAVGAGKINPRYSVRLKPALEENGFRIRETADTALAVISRASGENYDNNACPGEYYLSEAEEQMIQQLTESCTHVIVLINSGYPMDVRWLETYGIDAALWCGFPGMLGAKAVSDLLCGKANPCGKLPDTWSLDYNDIPSSRNFYQPESPEKALDADHDVWLDTVYEEDIYVGYRYFESVQKPVAFPFGHGLSYTNFDQDAKLSDGDLALDETLSFEVRVTNTGDCAGKENAALYMTAPQGRLEKPERQLIAFGKTNILTPGQAEILKLSVPVRYLASFDEMTSSWVLEPGQYRFYIGGSVHEAVLCGTVDLSEERVLQKLHDYCQPNIEFSRMSRFDHALPSGRLSGIREDVHELTPRSSRRHIKEAYVPELHEVDDWTDGELARMSVCASAGWGMHQKGEAGRIFNLEGRDIPYYACADGNSGVNVNNRNIGFPCSNLLCASWDKDLAYEAGRVIAEEAKDNGIQMILATAMNIHRNPLCGRHPEYFSEDPLLTGLMAGNQCRGLEEHGISSSMKHVVCNNSESSRKRNQSIVSQRALREIYIRPFEIAFDVHKPDSIMTGYNALNGVFAAEDEELLIGIFRNELGFEGFIMTDWNSYDTVNIPLAVNSGNSWMTPGSEDDTYVRPILAALENGTLDEERLRNNIRYLMRVVRRRTSENS